jgi:hypothetical protein
MHPGQTDKIRLAHSWLLDQLNKEVGCNAGKSHKTGLATRL